jgi:flagellar basal-body rod protein FlgG
MIQGVYQSAAATDALKTWNDVIASNIAGATTPGFKKGGLSFEGIASGIIGVAGSQEQPAISPHPMGTIDFEPGEMQRTGDPNEFAISGNGFFRLQGPNGQNVYTRDGQFRVSPEGQVVSKQGFPVIGESGTLQLLIDGGPVSVDSEGRVLQGDQEVGVLSVYEFSNPNFLKRGPGGFMVNPDQPQTPVPSETARVYQGFIEMSNVSSIRQMVQMVEASNAQRANERVIQNYDGLSERAIRILGGA